MSFLCRLVGVCGFMSCDYEHSYYALLIYNIYKNVVFDAFLFINYEGLGKSTIPSTESTNKHDVTRG